VTYKTLVVGPQTWTHTANTRDYFGVKLTRTQLPLLHAWAITVHKSQVGVRPLQYSCNNLQAGLPVAQTIRPTALALTGSHYLPELMWTACCFLTVSCDGGCAVIVGSSVVLHCCNHMLRAITCSRVFRLEDAICAIPVLVCCC
jgi:hypothetical protein